MKKSILTALLLICAVGLMAQKSQYFTYDRETVNAVIDQITETGTAGSPVFLPKDDPKGKEIHGFGYFVRGYVPGCLGSLGGMLIGGVLGYTWQGLLIGSAIGLVVPPVLVLVKSKTIGSTLMTGFGGVMGVATTTGTAAAVVAYMYYKLEREVENSLNSCSSTMLMPLVLRLL